MISRERAERIDEIMRLIEQLIDAKINERQNSEYGWDAIRYRDAIGEKLGELLS